LWVEKEKKKWEGAPLDTTVRIRHIFRGKKEKNPSKQRCDGEKVSN